MLHATFVGFSCYGPQERTLMASFTVSHRYFSFLFPDSDSNEKIKKFNRSLNSSEPKIPMSCCCCSLPASTALCMVPSCPWRSCFVFIVRHKAGRPAAPLARLGSRRIVPCARNMPSLPSKDCGSAGALCGWSRLAVRLGFVFGYETTTLIKFIFWGFFVKK